MKYLNMENAQIEIRVNSISNLKKILKLYISDFEQLNIKRLIISTSYKDLNKFIKVINDNVNFNNISFLIMIKTNLIYVPSVSFENIILINVSNKIHNNKNIYNQIVLKREKIDSITKALHNDINIIVEPKIDVNNIKEFNDLLLELYDKNLDMEISLDGFLIPISLIKEHPCNAYLCDGWKCGLKISQLPRVLYIDENYMIYPHKLLTPNLCVGKLDGNLSIILKEYLNSEQYMYLRELEKRVFIKYVLNYPYDLFPLDRYLELEFLYDKQS
ncbi:MAG: hypothetical protein IJO43_01150 [Bacilli bacterium]|nr:hypothetical protein [Bacilli bacterium]